MSRSTYSVKEIFPTIQGEGYWAGHVCVFVRFAGCNIWSGREEDRQKGTARGLCAAWCDTNFVGTDGPLGGHYTARELADVVSAELDKLCGHSIYHRFRRMIVCTGGEPTLQLDHDLVETFHMRAQARIHIETNGSNYIFAREDDWVTLSPKPPCELSWNAVSRANEIKVVYPAVPEDYIMDLEKKTRSKSSNTLLWIQPMDPTFSGAANATAKDNYAAAFDFVMRNPRWRLSLQTHKILGVP